MHNSRLPIAALSALKANSTHKSASTHSSPLRLKELPVFNPSILRGRRALKINPAGRSSAAPPKSTPTWHLSAIALRRPHKNKATAFLPRTFGASCELRRPSGRVLSPPAVPWSGCRSACRAASQRAWECVDCSASVL